MLDFITLSWFKAIFAWT